MAIKKPTKKHVQERDHYRCRKCNANKNIQFHHVLPQRLEGPDIDYNLVCLCHDCHAAWHQIENYLGIGCMEKRVVEIFYSWLREGTDAKIFLGNRGVWKKYCAAKKLSRRKKKEPRKHLAAKAR